MPFHAVQVASGRTSLTRATFAGSPPTMSKGSWRVERLTEAHAHVAPLGGEPRQVADHCSGWVLLQLTQGLGPPGTFAVTW